MNDQNECIGWSTAVKYTICNGSCQRGSACRWIAGDATGGSVTIMSNSCFGSWACVAIGRYANSGTSEVNVEVGTGACNADHTCDSIGTTYEYITYIQVPDYECNDNYSCQHCGRDSTFTGTFVATTDCCDDGVANRTDEACTSTDAPSSLPSMIPSEIPSSFPSMVPSEIPSLLPSLSPSSLPSLDSSSPPSFIAVAENPCTNINCSKRGKCKVLSSTEAECKCENTFIQSENKLDCICPSNHDFHANVNRCFPITDSPSKSPTLSPTLAPTASPTPAVTEDKQDDEDPCIDDVTGTFTLDNGNTADCKWILKNKKRSDKRKGKYCIREEVMNMCPLSCNICSS